MANRLDFVIFGATGFTGKRAVEELPKLIKSKGLSFTWGVAGRSGNKLKDVLKECGDRIDEDLTNTPIIIADVEDEASLRAMTVQAKCILNCCGPYRLYGAQVVKACIETGTHQVDVTGEPQYMEETALAHQKEAAEKGAYIVNGCGFDSIPADLGVVFLQQNFDGTLNSVESYLEDVSEMRNRSGPVANYGTWQSAVLGIADSGKLRDLRRKLFPTPLPKFTPKLEPRAAIHKPDVVDGYSLHFPGADRSVIIRTQRYLFENEKKRPVQAYPYFVLNSLTALSLLVIVGGIFMLFTKFAYGRKLLLKYPEFFSLGLFSTKPPNEEGVRKSRFRMTFHGIGWSERLAEPQDQFPTPPNREVILRVEADDYGYGFTTKAMILCGIVILTEKNKLPTKGGVYTPGMAFGNTSLIKQLQESCCSFKIVSTKSI